MSNPKSRPPAHNEQKRARQRARRYGVWTEIFASLALRLRGYKILARNFRTKAGEIDIVARKGDLVAFVEVKARRDLQTSLDAVGFETQQRIYAAADWWMASRVDAHLLSQRFDIVAVQPWRWPRHFPDAF